MTIRNLMLAAVATLGLATTAVGCGGTDLCERNKKIADLACKPTTPAMMTTMTTMTSMMTMACTDAGCTAADKDKINAFMDCVEAIGACTAGKELEWIGKVGACAPKAEGVSKECSAAGMK